MTISLADVLQQFPFEAGRTYHCEFGGLQVEVRVEQKLPVVLPAPVNGSDVMLDPWIDLPAPSTTSILQASAGLALLPDAPLIL
jgi:hypothetical protein